jgi:hypothetical protein
MMNTPLMILHPAMELTGSKISLRDKPKKTNNKTEIPNKFQRLK